MTALMRSILIINPNSTTAMTEGLRPLVKALGFHDSTTYTYFTASSGPASINDERDIAASASQCLPELRPLLSAHDAFLVACFSPHPLVAALKVTAPDKPTTGIFEASIASALQIVAPGKRFGIVSTGRAWETVLGEAVRTFLGTLHASRYRSTETTGLNAAELHEMPPELVRMRMKEATARLVAARDVGAVCLGCAGMAGMGEMVREACIETLGEEEGRRVRIIDGVQAGVAWLEGVLRAGV